MTGPEGAQVSSEQPCVMIVEPRKQLREALKEVLADTFRVLAGQTASGAIVGFEHHTPRVVLLAMQQSDGNGFDLCRRMAKLDGSDRSLFVVYGPHPPDLPEFAEEDVQAQYGVGRYVPSGATLKGLAEIAQEHLRGGWKFQAAGQAPGDGEERAPDPRWDNPFTSDAVVSAKNTEEDVGGFSLRRLFKKRG
jgi:CheY-like chemotaxis protein